MSGSQRQGNQAGFSFGKGEYMHEGLDHFRGRRCAM